VTMHSKAMVCGHSIAGIMGLNPAEDMDVHLVCCVDSSLCYGPITHSEETDRVFV
jgi:hypothetical protein